MTAGSTSFSKFDSAVVVGAASSLGTTGGTLSVGVVAGELKLDLFECAMVSRRQREGMTKTRDEE